MALDWPYTQHKSQGATYRHALDWNTQGTRGVDEKNWKRTREWELQKAGES
jgi:hypothetical protein